MVWKSVVPGLRVSERHDRGVVQVRLAGELDLATGPVALRLLLDAAARSRTVELDLAWVTFVDAFAYGRLLEARARVSARGGELILGRVHPVARRVLNLLDLGEPFVAVREGAASSVAPAATVVTILEEAIDAGLRTSGADMANAQLLDPSDRSLRIVSHRGFRQAFLNFFEVVDGAESACGAALAEQRAVWVSDVSRSDIFAGTPALDAMLDANAQAVASLPVERPTGELAAVFSVHRHRIGHWTERQRRALEEIARGAGQQLAAT